MRAFFVACAAAAAVSVSVGAAIGTSETQRLAEAAQVVQDIQATIPAAYWNKARCVAVIPDLKKAAFIIGGEYGKGVMSCRAGERWSAPVFMQLAKGSWGFQAGAEEIDVVLLVMNEEGVQKLLQNKVTLGADASIAAGPLGRQGQAATDATLNAEIVSYSRAKGLFAGINLSGGVLRPDVDANRSVYGTGASPKTILAMRELSAPTEAHAFLTALHAQTAAATTTGRSREPERSSGPESTVGQASGTPPSRTLTTTDDDLRARVVEIQQALDRMLADTTPNTVGTSGRTGAPSDTVTVDRSRLLQMRQQLEGLLAILNRR